MRFIKYVDNNNDSEERALDIGVSMTGSHKNRMTKMTGHKGEIQQIKYTNNYKQIYNIITKKSFPSTSLPFLVI